MKNELLTNSIRLERNKNLHGKVVVVTGAVNGLGRELANVAASFETRLVLIGAPIGYTLLCPFWMQTNINDSQRNRPQNLANIDPGSPNLSAAIVNKADSACVKPAKQMAVLTFAAILEDRFYVFSDLAMLLNVGTRMQDILQQRNPSDHYSQMPHIHKYIERGLKLRN